MRRLACSGLVVLAGGTALAQTNDLSAALCPDGARIAAIEVERINVFDPTTPGEDRWAYGAVNWLHRLNMTRETTVRSLLTVREGDPCVTGALHEAERELRRYRIFQDAWITTEPVGDNQVLVHVRVRDAWSTRAKASFSSQGGANRTTVKIQENNLLGTGYRLQWSRITDQDRTSTDFDFAIPTIAGSRWRASGLYGSNSDGSTRTLTLERPFYKLDARRSFAVNWSDRIFDQKIYVGRDPVDVWQLDDEDASISYGWAPYGLTKGRVRRQFLSLSRTALARLGHRNTAVARPDLAPVERNQVRLGWRGTWEHVDFRRLSFYNSSRRVEDFDIGTSFQLGFGVALPSVSPQNGGNYFATIRRGLDLGGGHFAALSASVTGERIEGVWFDQIVQLGAEFWFKASQLNTFYLQGVLAAGHDLEGPQRFLLGADTGLRGYRTRSFSGDNLLLLNIEHRYFAPWELFHLFRVGFIDFVDLGSTWDGSLSRIGSLHGNIGAGLRLEILRSSTGTTIQFNAAYPIDPSAAPGEKRGLVFSVVTGQGF